MGMNAILLLDVICEFLILIKLKIKIELNVGHSYEVRKSTAYTTMSYLFCTVITLTLVHSEKRRNVTV